MRVDLGEVTQRAGCYWRAISEVAVKCLEDAGEGREGGEGGDRRQSQRCSAACYIPDVLPPCQRYMSPRAQCSC